MNGILCMDKPAGFTSFDVVAKLRGMAKTKKIGHGGTLDPMATGVLPLFLGGATKACDLLPRQDKRYTATFRLGVTTDTLDITGKVLRESPVTADFHQVREALRGFTGSITQVPPMYSAVQVKGVRLYELARQGREVERPSREVEIHTLELLECCEEEHLYTIDVHCSKGTYIRSLCHDLGELLGCGAVLTGLRRTMACGFTEGQAMTLEQAQELVDTGMLEQRLLPVEEAFTSLPGLHLDAQLARLMQNGVRLGANQLPTECPEGVLHRVYGPENRFLGLAFVEGEKLKLKKLFVREADG